MKKLVKQKKKIEDLQTVLNDLIKSKGNLQDSEIIRINESLDKHIVEYQKLLKTEKGCKEYL